MKRPWMKWYPSDYRADPRVRMCSLAARGLWSDMLWYMHEGEPYGHLTINGRAPKLDEIANLVGRPEREVEKAFGELVRQQVFSTASGVIYSRRMVRDHEKEERDRLNGKGGGNPKLINKDKVLDNRWVNPPDKGEDKAHMLELESRKKKQNKNSVSMGTRIPEGWDASIQEIEFARSQGLSDNAIAEEEASFRDYWKGRAGAGARKADWEATWRSWIRRYCDRRPNGMSAKPRPGSREDRQEKTANAYAKLREYARAGADDEGKSDDAGDPPFGLLPFVKPPRS